MNRQIEKLGADLSEEFDSSTLIREQLDKVQFDLKGKDKKIHLVSTELNKRTNAIHSMTELMEEKEREHEDTKTLVKNLQSSLKRFTDEETIKNTEIEDKLQTIEQENSKLKFLLEEAMSKNFELGEKYTTSCVQLDSTKEEKYKLTEQLNDSKQIIEATTAELQKKLKASYKEIEVHVETRIQLESRERAQNEEIMNLKNILEETNAQSSTVSSNFNKIQSCLFESSEKCSGLENALGSLQATQLVIKKECDETKEKLSKTSKELKCAQENISDLQNRLHEANLTVKNITNDCVEMKTQKDITLKEKLDMSHQLDTTKLLLNKKDSELLHLSQEHSQLKAILQSRNECRETEFHSSIDAIKKEKIHLSNEYNNKIKAYQDDLNSKEKRIHVLEAEQTTATQFMDDLRQKETMTSKQVSDLEKQLELCNITFKDELQLIQNENITLNNDLHDFYATKLQCDKMSKNIHNLQENLVSSKAELELCRQELKASDRDQQLSKMQEMFAESVKEKEDFIDKLQSDIEAKQDTIEHLQSTVDEKDVVVEQLGNDVQASQSQEEKLRDSLEMLQQQLGSVEHQLANDQDAMKAALREAEKKASDRDQQLSKMQEMFAESVKEKEDFIDKLQSDIQEKEESIESLAIDFCDSKKENEDLVVNFVETERENAELLATLKEQSRTLTMASDKMKLLAMTIDEERRISQNFAHEKSMLESELHEQMNWHLSQLEDEQTIHQAVTSSMAKRYEDKISESTKRLDTYQSEVKRLNDDLSQSQQSVDAVSASFDIAQKEWIRQKVALTADFIGKEETINVLLTEKESILQSLEESENKNTEVEKHILTLNEQIEKNQEDIKELMQTTTQFKSIVEKNEESFHTIIDELLLACEELEFSSLPQIDDQNYHQYILNFVKILRDNAKDFKTNAIACFELANSRERATSRLERTLTSKERDIESLHSQVDRFKIVMKDLKNQHKDARERNDVLEKKVNNLELDMTELEDNATHFEEATVDLQEQKNLLETDIKYHKDELDSVRGKMRDAEIQSKEYEVKLTIFKQALSVADEKYKENNELLSSQSTYISTLEQDLETVSSEVEALVQQNESLEKDLSSMLLKLQKSEQNEKSANSMIAEFEITLRQQASMFETLENENTILFQDNQQLIVDLDACNDSLLQAQTDLHQTRLNLTTQKDKYNAQHDKVESLENELKGVKAESEETINAITVDKEEMMNKYSALENSCQEAQNRLSGAARIATIHDKECVKLLNDIETKREEINLLASKVIELETDKNELESTSQKQRHNLTSLESLLQSNVDLLRDSQESFRKATKEKEDLQSRFDSLSNEMNIRKKSIMKLEKELNELTQEKSISDIEAIRTQHESISSANNEDESHQDPVNKTNQKLDSTCITSSTNFSVLKNLSSPSMFSPSTSDIVTKHSDLLDDLVKMKTIIRDAITPVKQDRINLSKEEEDGSDNALSLLETELQEKNNVLSMMEEQIDYLLRDISMARKALSEKDDSLTILEKEKHDLIVQMKNMQTYLKQVEQSLCTELKRRRKLEHELKAVKQEYKGLDFEYESKCAALGETKRALAKKTRDVDEREDVARQLAHQLQTTKSKIINLKTHLKLEGLLQETPKANKKR